MKTASGNKAPQNDADTSSHGGFSRMLCVDDSPLLLEALARGFTVYGFEVITALQGIDALMQFQAHDGKFGVIVTDNEMPLMNGLEFVRSVRALGFKGQILVMSGRLSSSDGRAYEPYLITGFLHKPFDVGMVATMLLSPLT